ncbi:unnamed protein product [Choristocarpus tenellus]
MATSVVHVLIIALFYCAVAVAKQPFATALDLVIQHHGGDVVSRTKSVQALAVVVDNLKTHPGEDRYRRIRLLNKGFWEKIGSANGGIAFMTALGFELVDEGQGPIFVMQPGEASVDLDEVGALIREKLTEASSGNMPTSDKDEEPIETVSPSTSGSRSGFDPFTTSFSRKSRTHFQERVETHLSELTRLRATLQQTFSGVGERNVTILLPQMTQDILQEGQGWSESENEELQEGTADLELIMRVWRNRQRSILEPEKFETTAARELKQLRTTKLYPFLLVRIRLPNGAYIQARFSLDESIKTVYETLGAVLDTEGGGTSNTCSGFELFKAPPTQILAKDSTSLRETGVVPPASVIHLRWVKEFKDQGMELEKVLTRRSNLSPYPRLDYSPRYDFPEPKTLRRTQNAHEKGA